MEKSALTISFAHAVVDITIFRPFSTIDTPLPYGCSPLGSFQVGYSDVWSEQIPIGCSRAQLKAPIGSLPNVNRNGLLFNSQESFLMLDTVVFVYEVELDHNANWSLDTLDLSLLSNGVDFAYGSMKSLQTSSWPVNVTRSSLTVLSLGHGESVSQSMNATQRHWFHTWGRCIPRTAVVFFRSPFTSFPCVNFLLFTTVAIILPLWKIPPFPSVTFSSSPPLRMAALSIIQR
jgi:hypothetical protein